jgi:hypothetical protein
MRAQQALIQLSQLGLLPAPPGLSLFGLDHGHRTAENLDSNHMASRHAQHAPGPSATAKSRGRPGEAGAAKHGPTPSLCAVFQQLKSKDVRCVLKVRKLQQLAAKYRAKTADAVRRHFEQLGAVEEVHVVHSQIKANHGNSARCKPSGLGFVVMRHPEDVEAMLRLGSEQLIHGVTIGVERFSMLGSDTAGKVDTAPVVSMSL